MILQPYPPTPAVVGQLMVWPQVYSPQLGNRRDLLIHLPLSYGHTDRYYPVIYAHDGQNLFDPATSFVEEWQMDEVLLGLAGEGLEAIVVALPNQGDDRRHEYSPFIDPQYGGGRGDRYLQFIVETVKPQVDAALRTRPEAAQTSLLGSSMGGYISLYGLYRWPQVFGQAAVISPAIWFAGGQMFTWVASQPRPVGRLYMDVGHQELALDRQRSQDYLEEVRHMDRILRQQGWELPQYCYLEDPHGQHREADWVRRLPEILRFLLRP